MQIVIVEDRGVFRQGLRLLVGQEPDMVVIGEAADGESAVRLAQQLQPDVVIMDITLPKLSGMEVIRHIHAHLPATKIVVLSAHVERRFIKDAFAAGASAYVPKSAESEELLRAVRAVAEGDRHIGACVTNLVLNDWLASPTGPGGETTKELSSRHLQVLQLTAEGKTVKEIARRLHISVKTAHANRRQLMDKLGVSTVAELTRYAIDKGISPL